MPSHMDTSKVISEQVISPKGEKIASDHFIGTAWLQIPVPDDGAFHRPVFPATFEPGARNNRHKHPGGQILFVTGGKGYYKEEGRPIQVLREGDGAKIQPDVKHRHGAVPESWLTHVAISTNAQRGDAEWLEPVTDEEPTAINQGVAKPVGGRAP